MVHSTYLVFFYLCFSILRLLKKIEFLFPAPQQIGLLRETIKRVNCHPPQARKCENGKCEVRSCINIKSV